MSRSLCPECGARRGLARYEEGEYCYACKYRNNNKSLIKIDNSMKEQDIEIGNIPNEAKLWLLKLGINDEIIKKRNIKWSVNYERIVFYYYDFSWLRTLDKTRKDKWLFKGERNDRMYWLDNIKNVFTDNLVITEDVISCIRVSEHCDCVALGGTNVYNKNLPNILNNYKQILVWLDGDEAGRKAAEQFRKRYKLTHNIKIIKTLKDPKEFTDNEIKDILND